MTVQPTQIAILILAAGASTRMAGGDKLLEIVDGRPLLTVMIARALATSARVFVTLPDAQSPRAALMSGGATALYVADANTGMAASLRAGVAALPTDCTAVMILPADMPDLQTAELVQMITAFDADPHAPILRATTPDGKMGHPVILPQRFFAQIAHLTGDRGASPILKAHQDQIRTVAFADNRAITDLDTPQDWTIWRAANPA